MKPAVASALRKLDQQFDAVRAMPTPIPSAERYRSSIEDVKEGGYIRVSGELFSVVDVSRYQEKGSAWYELELFGLYGGETRYLEWEKDDEVEVAFNDPAISLRDIGQTSDEIEEMSEDEKGTIRYGGRSYAYDDDYGATYHRGGDGAGERVYFYDFETSDERYCLTVEEWGTEQDGFEYEVYVSEYLEPGAIEVVVVGSASGSGGGG